MAEEEPLTIDKLLADSCSNPSSIEGYNVYTITLHCLEYEVVAKPLGFGKYEVLSYTGRSI